MKKFFFLTLIAACFPILADAKQFLTDIIENNTITITAQKTGELGKNYFYCSNENKCSTEQVVRLSYKNNGYNIMRAEYSFWKGMFVLVFLDEFYPHTLDIKTDNKFFDKPLDNIPDKDIDSKYRLICKINLQEFMNSQIKRHEEGSYIRWLDEWEIEGYKNPIDYFKSPVVQEFLTRIDNKTFCTVLKHILKVKDKILLVHLIILFGTIKK